VTVLQFKPLPIIRKDISIPSEKPTGEDASLPVQRRQGKGSAARFRRIAKSA